MVELIAASDEAGTWLRVEDNGVEIVGVYRQQAAPGGAFTLTWVADMRPRNLLKFCKDAENLLSRSERGIGPKRVNRRGKAFAAGRLAVWEGGHWLDAAAVTKAEFVRLEFSLHASQNRESENFILWSRMGLSKGSMSDREVDYDDPTSGIYLPLRSLLALKDTVPSLIANSHVLSPSIGLARQAVRLVADHLDPEPSPRAAAA